MDQLSAASGPVFTSYMRHPSKVVNYLNGDTKYDVKIRPFEESQHHVKLAYKAWIDRETTKEAEIHITDQKLSIGEIDKYYKSNSLITGTQTSGHENKNLWGPTNEGNYIQRFIVQVSRSADKRGFNGFKNQLLLFKIIQTEGKEFFISDTLIWSECNATVGFRKHDVTFVRDVSTQTDFTACSTAEVPHKRPVGDEPDTAADDRVRLRQRKTHRYSHQS